MVKPESTQPNPSSPPSPADPARAAQLARQPIPPAIEQAIAELSWQSRLAGMWGERDHFDPRFRRHEAKSAESRAALRAAIAAALAEEKQQNAVRLDALNWIADNYPEVTEAYLTSRAQPDATGASER